MHLYAVMREYFGFFPDDYYEEVIEKVPPILVILLWKMA